MSKTTDIPLGEGRQIQFGIVGSGWRSEFYLRIAKELPQYFKVCGLVTRNTESRERLEKDWGIKTYSAIYDLLEAENPEFMVVSVTSHAIPDVIKSLAAENIPVLAETPPAPDLDKLIELNKLTLEGAKIQVAEQYHLHPAHASRIAIANSGLLGTVSHAQVSFSHGYHGVSMLRKLLGIGFENAEINGFRFNSRSVSGFSRKGLSNEETLAEAPHEFAIFDFGGKTALYDFERDQHRSFVRTQRIIARGERGEIANNTVKYLKDFKTPIEYDFIRKNTGEEGNMEGYFLKGILAGNEWVYTNPFIPGKLSDDEIAVASCLAKMSVCVKEGTDFYSLAEASQDQYLALMMTRAINTGEKVKTLTQPWAD